MSGNVIAGVSGLAHKGDDVIGYVPFVDCGLITRLIYGGVGWWGGGVVGGPVANTPGQRFYLTISNRSLHYNNSYWSLIQLQRSHSVHLVHVSAGCPQRPPSFYTQHRTFIAFS